MEWADRNGSSHGTGPYRRPCSPRSSHGHAHPGTAGDAAGPLWDTGFRLEGDVHVPNEEARTTLGTRYIDWSITVPLLTVELLAVCSVAGAAARKLRFTTMAAAFLMIVTGYMGSQVLSQGRDATALVVWGPISTAFFVYLYVALIGAVRHPSPRWARRRPPACATRRSCC